MKKIIYHTLFFICLASITACKGGIGGSAMTGEPGELLVIINDELKNAETGEKVLEILNEEDSGLTQSEPPFSTIMLSRNNFSSTFRSYRNILFLDVNKKYTTPQIQYRKDLWAQHQAYVSVGVGTAEELSTVLQNKHDNIIEYFVKSEIERYQQLYKEANNQIVEKSIKKQFDINISVPNGYNVNKIADDFMWISLESKVHSQGLIIYERPYTDTAQFNKTALLNYRDSIVKVHIPGPSEGSYMTTEYILPIQYKIGTYVNDDYTIELRGKWRVENDFMAGPFTSYTFCNLQKNKLITIEGYVYYPNKEKRNFMRQLQAICRSVSFDKIVVKPENNGN
ncbi:MAG: DUF4837 family protein [Bacteroidales bacterium]|nr:DUF4837 family protein [Bacteroidales bacterium]